MHNYDYQETYLFNKIRLRLAQLGWELRTTKYYDFKKFLRSRYNKTYFGSLSVDQSIDLINYLDSIFKGDPNSFLIYDCEIINLIFQGTKKPGFNYCKNWNDFQGMGISLIGAYLSWDNSIRIYPQSAFSQFQKAVIKAGDVVGFNSTFFDDKLCQANGINIVTSYDILGAVRCAAGMPAKYVYGLTRKGYSLNELALANLGKEKTGSGALAPELWQSQKHWEVIKYLTNDVLLTRQLFQKIQQNQQLIDPTNDELIEVKFFT